MSHLADQQSFRKKVFWDEGWVLTYDDIICLPGYTDFKPDEVSVRSNIGPYQFNIPIISAAMDSVTGSNMAIAMALNGGLGAIHRNCPLESQLEMVKRVKRAHSYIIDDVATLPPDISIKEAKNRMENMGISGFVVVDAYKKVIGILTKRDIPFDDANINHPISEVMTKNPICLHVGVSRDEALRKLYEIRKEKIPLVDQNGILQGLITMKDLAPSFPNAVKDEKGRLLCGLGISPFMPAKDKRDIFLEIGRHVDIMFVDVAEFYKRMDIEGITEIMKFFKDNNVHTKFVLGNIGTYEAAVDILTNKYFSETDQFVGIKVGMGSGSICTTTIQTGVGAPTLFATAQVADAIKEYNPKISLISDGGFKYPGDLVKAFSVGADMIMSGHFFAGCTESPGIVDTIGGRKVKIYRGMGSAEARAVGSFADDRYIKESKKLAEGVSGYVPFTGPLKGVLEQLIEGLKNGMIYAGTKTLKETHNIKIGRITYSGKIEANVHDLQGRN